MGILLIGINCIFNYDYIENIKFIYIYIPYKSGTALVMKIQRDIERNNKRYTYILRLIICCTYFQLYLTF